MKTEAQKLLEAPICGICDQRVGRNEYDDESGGFFSEHFACYSLNPNGEWAARIEWFGRVHLERYTYRKMAERRARAAAEGNPQIAKEVARVWFTVINADPEK